MAQKIGDSRSNCVGNISNIVASQSAVGKAPLNDGDSLNAVQVFLFVTSICYLLSMYHLYMK